ncbi:MAG TPA: HNH endonuclease [Anaerolineales bacterium]|nr:HNH endonuclease [Anaerolineales bacterium]HNN13062.1 HNH endonuclease [Anaerolineales bacterium]
MALNKWTREELILAFNHYFKIPFGKIDDRTPEIIALAKIIGRTPSAVALKLANFAHFDPTLQERGIKGASHGSKLDAVIWAEFYGDIEKLSFESEVLLAKKTGKQVEEVAGIYVLDLPKEGREREALVKTRVNQSFFRKTILAAYSVRCCITGLSIPALLTASHIVPWSEDAENRMNPRNGLCLNALHDRAFDKGWITVTPDLKVKVSPKIQRITADKAASELILKYDGVSIKEPKRFLPDKKFLEYHNDVIFMK